MLISYCNKCNPVTLISSGSISRTRDRASPVAFKYMDTVRILNAATDPVPPSLSKCTCTTDVWLTVRRNSVWIRKTN